jgi:hypothetical protein
MIENLRLAFVALVIIVMMPVLGSLWSESKDGFEERRWRARSGTENKGIPNPKNYNTHPRR